MFTRRRNYVLDGVSYGLGTGQSQLPTPDDTMPDVPAVISGGTGMYTCLGLGAAAGYFIGKNITGAAIGALAGYALCRFIPTTTNITSEGVVEDVVSRPEVMTPNESNNSQEESF